LKVEASDMSIVLHHPETNEEMELTAAQSARARSPRER
jgi:hypothetical protein